MISILQSTEDENVELMTKLLCKHHGAVIGPKSEHELRKMNDEAMVDEIATSRQLWLEQKGQTGYPKWG